MNWGQHRLWRLSDLHAAKWCVNAPRNYRWRLTQRVIRKWLGSSVGEIRVMPSVVTAACPGRKHMKNECAKNKASNNRTEALRQRERDRENAVRRAKLACQKMHIRAGHYRVARRFRRGAHNGTASPKPLHALQVLLDRDITQADAVARQQSDGAVVVASGVVTIANETLDLIEFWRDFDRTTDDIWENFPVPQRYSVRYVTALINLIDGVFLITFGVIAIVLRAGAITTLFAFSYAEKIVRKIQSVRLRK